MEGLTLAGNLVKHFGGAAKTANAFKNVKFGWRDSNYQLKLAISRIPSCYFTMTTL